MTITLIAALSGDGFIARDGRIPWHLPADVAHFRAYCRNQCLLLGRRTWDEMQGWFQPGHTPVVISRNPALHIPGGHAAASVAEGLAWARSAGMPECVVIGGGAIYHEAIAMADRLILTAVHTTLGGDVPFPAVSPGNWTLVSAVSHPAGADQSPAFTIRHFQRLLPPSPSCPSPSAGSVSSPSGATRTIFQS